MDRHIFLAAAVLTLFCATNTSSDAQQDYFYLNNAYQIGSDLINGGAYQNSHACQVRVGYGGVRSYSPYEVSEYGFKNGRVFLARDIINNDTVRRVFLERLVKGKLTLYFYKGQDYKIFFLEIDSGNLIPVARLRGAEGVMYFRDQLFSLSSDCSQVQDVSDLVLYRQRSMASFAEAFNVCDQLEFAYTRFGLTFGYLNSTLIIPSGVAPDFLKGSAIPSVGSMTASLFLENPIGKRGLSMHYELQFERTNFDYYRYLINQYWMVINTSCINLPVMLRYTPRLQNKFIRPFISAGGNIAIVLKEDSQVMEDVMSGDVIVEENIYSADLLGNPYIGYLAGAGLQFHIWRRINLYTEFRYSYASAFGKPTLLRRQEWSLLAGINF